MDSFVSDFLYAFRVLFKRPGLTLMAIIALSLSLGMSTSTFSSLNGMFIKPLPFEEPDELHNIFLHNPRAEMKMMPIPYGQFRSLEGLESFREIMGYYSGTINVSGDGRPERYNGAFVTPNFLGILGHEPVLGRGFSETGKDSAGNREILISHDMWQERFRGDPEVLGTVVRANGAPHAIVGVLPGGFYFPVNSQAWMPLSPDLFPGDRDQTMHVVAVGRMTDGRTGRNARSELAELYATWSPDSLEQKEEMQLTCEPFGRLEWNNASQSLVVVTIGAVIFVLLVSCANVANLLVGRALTRGREMAIRSALGATRFRIIRQLLTESLVLALFGAIGGLLYAAWSVDAMMNEKTFELPYWMNFELDWRVFAFVLAITVATALVSGLAPAFQASKTDLNEMLKDTSHTSTSFRLGRLTRILAVIQVAFSCALLFGAGLVTRNVLQMNRIDPGFDQENVLTMRMGLFPEDYPGEADRDAFFAKLVDGVEAVPGVNNASVSSWLGQYGNFKEPFVMADEAQPKSGLSYAYVESVSPGHFDTLGMKTLEGATFGEPGPEGVPARAIVVNEVFVEQFMAGKPPVGRQVNLITGAPASDVDPARSWTIIGVVSAVRVSNFTSPDAVEPTIYTPYEQTPSPFMSLVVHAGTGSMDDLNKAIQQVILNLDPHLPVYFEKTMEEYMDEQIYPFRMLANFFLTIGLMALFLAAVGVYGMLAFNVSRRRREIGIRMALGANTRRIVTQVLRQGFIQVTIGILVGTGMAYVVGQLSRNFLLGINPLDPSVYAGVLFTLVGVAALAFFIPARRAARLSPMEALRYE